MIQLTLGLVLVSIEEAQTEATADSTIPFAISSASEVILPSDYSQQSVCGLQLESGTEELLVFGAKNDTEHILVYALENIKSPIFELERLPNDFDLSPPASIERCFGLHGSSAGVNGTRDVLVVDESRRLLHVAVTSSGETREKFWNAWVYKYTESAFDALPNLLIATAFEAPTGSTSVVYVDASGNSLVFGCFACVTPSVFTELHVQSLPASSGDPVRLLLRVQSVEGGERGEISKAEATVVFESGEAFVYVRAVSSGIVTVTSVNSEYAVAIEQGTFKGIALIPQVYHAKELLFGSRFCLC